MEINTVYEDGRTLPLNLALWLAYDTYDHSEDPNSISATTIIRSPRYIIAGIRKKLGTLEIKDYVEPTLESILKARIGTAIHEAVDRAWGDEDARDRLLTQLGYNAIEQATLDVIHEERFSKQVGKFELNGKVDFIVDGVLHDVKTTGTYSWITGCNDKKYIQQGSIYRWLNPEKITEDYMVIDFVFTNWNVKESSQENYPPKQIMSKGFELMSLEETEKFIKDKIALIEKYYDEPDLSKIPCCTEEELYPVPPKYKYYANEESYHEGKRCTKSFDNYYDAMAYKESRGKGIVIIDKGKPFTCPYCKVEHE